MHYSIPFKVVFSGWIIIRADLRLELCVFISDDVIPMIVHLNSWIMTLELPLNKLGDASSTKRLIS